MALDPFGVYGGSSSGAATKASNRVGGTTKSNAGASYDPFGIMKQQLQTPVGSSQSSQVKQPQIQQQQQPKSLFDKIITGAKNVAKDTVKSTVNTGEKALNTTAAGVANLTGLATAGVQNATGNKAGAQRTLKGTQQESNAFLTKGYGGAGGYLTPQQAASGGGGVKSLKENFIKPTAKATADIAPLVIPVGAEVKGASMAAKVARSAATNAAVGGGTTAAQQVLDGHVNGKDVLKSAALAGTIGAAVPVLDKGLAKGAAVASEARGSTAAAKQLAANTHANALTDLAKQTVSPETVAKHPTATPAHVTAVNDYIKGAHAADSSFQQAMGNIAQSNKLDYHPGPPKEADRAFSKVMEDYHGNPNELKDAIRGTITIPDHSPEAVNKVVDAIGKEAKVVNVKNLYESKTSGYRDIKVTVETPTGHKGEVILATPEMLDAKRNQGGHDLYQTYRDTSKSPAEQAAAEAKMNDLYGAAHEAATSRLASSSDLPSLTKSDTAVAGDTGTASSRTPPTPLETPVSTTVSTTPPSGRGRTASTVPSDSKNLGVDGSIPTSIAEKAPAVKPDNVITHGGKDYQLSGSALDDYKAAKATRDDTVATWAKDKSANGEGRRKRANMQLYMATKAIVNKGKGVSEYNRVVKEPTAKPVAAATKPKIALAAKKPTPTTPKTLTPVQTAHLPDIGGYTHSTHMVTDYADMLRGMEKNVKGGQMVADGQGGYKRISEHSPFYRDFYAEHKKAPTKADYVDEAKRQLASGKAVHGGSEDYKALLEREAKPLPTQKVNVQPLQSSGKTKTSKLALGVEQSAIKEKLAKSLGDLPQYSKVNMREQAKFATDLMQNDENRAIRIAKGEEAPPAHILPESVYTAVELKARASKDINLLRELANSSLTTEATAMGQRIRALGERDTSSPVEAMRQLTDTRKAAFEAKAKTTVAKATSNEIKAIRAAKPRVTKETWSGFVDSLKC